MEAGPSDTQNLPLDKGKDPMVPQPPLYEDEARQELEKWIKFIGGNRNRLRTHFVIDAVYWDTINLAEATLPQQCTWALMTLAEVETLTHSVLTKMTADEFLNDDQTKFQGFTLDDFEHFPPLLRSALHNTLHRNGIYVGHKNKNFAEALSNLISTDELPI
ncbi:hypothetical protein GGR50DRAFT_700811 [Xylaria sp. CBS 124048]|nr:hypothetical protein GGR50DRAFT_700811 [Xylaria sp. CBS 124048]